MKKNIFSPGGPGNPGGPGGPGNPWESQDPVTSGEVASAVTDRTDKAKIQTSRAGGQTDKYSHKLKDGFSWKIMFPTLSRQPGLPVSRNNCELGHKERLPSTFLLLFLKSLLNLLQYCFCFMSWCFGWEACGISAPWLGIEITTPALEEVLTTGLPRKSAPHRPPSYLMGCNQGQR